MSKILIAVDGSDLAARAATTAVHLLGPGHSYTVLEAFHVVIPAPVSRLGAFPPYSIPPSPEDLLAESRGAEAEAASDVALVVRRLGVPARALVEAGAPVEVIRRVVGQWGADLVVVGSHGKGLAQRVFLGSVSHELLKEPPCPVLVVPVRPAD